MITVIFAFISLIRNASDKRNAWWGGEWVCVTRVLPADLDECVEEHGCSHGCRNTEGSFVCTCPQGLSLAPDGFTCRGKKFF